MGKIARRYAKAYFDLCDISDLDTAQKQLQTLSGIYQRNEELKAALKNPAYPQEQRIASIKALAERIAPKNASFQNFAALLVEKDRLSELPQICEEFILLAEEMKKLFALEFITASEVVSAEKDSLLEKAKQSFGPLTTISWKTDQDLLGGLMVRAGDKLLDGSIRGRLEKMKEHLLSL